GTEILGEVEHVLLGLAALAGECRPRLVDVDMAGCAGALPAAVAVDPGHGMVRRRLHQRRADRHVDRMARAVERRIGDPGHRLLASMSSPGAAARPRAVAPTRTRMADRGDD